MVRVGMEHLHARKRSQVLIQIPPVVQLLPSKAILGGAKLPKMDTLKEEGRKLSEQKKKLYAEYRKTKADMQEVTTIKANIDYLLGYSEPGRKKEQER